MIHRIKNISRYLLPFRIGLLIGLFWVINLKDSNVLAGDDTRSGTVGATEVLIPVDPSGISLGGAVGARVSGPEAMFWNPAGLAQLPSPAIQFSTLSYLADIQLHEFTSGLPIGQYGALGLMIRSIDFGKIPLTTSDDPEGELGRDFSPTYFLASVGWAGHITENIKTGVALKYIHEEIIRARATGVAFDLGLQIATPFGFHLGLVFQNLGPNMSFGGSSLEQEPSQNSVETEIQTAEFELPTSFEVSIAAEKRLDRFNALNWMLSYKQYGFQSDDLHLGVEYDFREQFFVRSGFELDLENTGESVFSSSYALGCGINYNLKGYQMSFNYAYRSARYFSGNHAFSVKLSL
jgi:hypothetical protein